MLVQSDELAQSVRVELGAKDAGGRTVALEAASRHDPLGRALGAHLVGRLAKGQGLGLRQEVAQEQLMHVLALALDGVGAVGKGNEVGRHGLGALVNELVEGMLAVGARLAPEDLAGAAGHGAAIPADALAVGLHGQLLQVRGEAMQVLVVRQHGVGLVLEEVVVPDVGHGHEGDDVALERGLLEVHVHIVEAGEQLLEGLLAVGQDQSQTHRGVHGVTAADPAPEAKGVDRVDAKVGHELEVGGDGHEVLGDGLGLLLGAVVDGAGLAQRVEQPPTGHLGVGDGLERGEGLGDDDHQRGLGIEALDLLGDVVGVDVRDKAARGAGDVGLEGLVDHDRAQVGATDADGDDVLDLLAGDALPLAGAHALGEGIHLVEHLVHVGHGVCAVDDVLADIGLGATQAGVEHGAVLGGVDVLAGKHGVATLLHARGAAEIEQQAHRLVGHEVLGEVEVQVGGIKAQLGNAVGIGGKPVLEADPLGLEGVEVVLEGLPLGRCGDVDRCSDVGHGGLLVLGGLWT